MEQQLGETISVAKWSGRAVRRGSPYFKEVSVIDEAVLTMNEIYLTLSHQPTVSMDDQSVQLGLAWWVAFAD